MVLGKTALMQRPVGRADNVIGAEDEEKQHETNQNACHRISGFESSSPMSRSDRSGVPIMRRRS